MMRPDDRVGRTAKLAELDAVRGIAALVVFNEHFFNSMTFRIHDALRATPLFAFLDGSSAVMLFFVLSGFVLTIRPLRSGAAVSLAAPALRRWPRLAVPMMMAGVFYVVADRTGAFPKTSWLHGIGADFPPALLWGQYMEDHHVGPVLREAAIGIFLHKLAKHNPVLWTMMWELYGSLVAFVIALCMIFRMPTAAKIGLFGVLAVLTSSISPWLVGFPFGVAAAVFHIRCGDRARLPLALGGLILLLALPVLAWDVEHGAGIWAWTDRLPLGVQFYLWAVCESVVSLSVMAVALYCAPIRRLLRTAPAQLLGTLSFPLYLTHLLTILSLGAWLGYALFPAGIGVGASLVLYLPVLGAALLVSWPLAAFDRVWVAWLSRGSVAAVASAKQAGSSLKTIINNRLRLVPWLLLAVIPVVAHAPALTPWFRFDPVLLISGTTADTWSSNGWLAGYPGWIDGNAGVTTEAAGAYAARQWLSGHVPWWNPLAGVGLPMVAEGQTTALFLPFGLLLALPHGLLLLRILLCVLAGWVTYALLLELRVGRLPAFVGAALFGLNGTLAWFAHGPIMPVAFLPLILLGLEQARTGRFPWMAGLGTAWSFLAGFPETAAINLLLGGVWAALRLWQTPHRLSYAVRVSLAVGAGLLVAAPAIWPFVEALPREFLGGNGGPVGAGWRAANLGLLLFPYSQGNLMGSLAVRAQTDDAWYRTGGYLDAAIVFLALASLRRRVPEQALRATLLAWMVLTAAKAAGVPWMVDLFDTIPFIGQANLHIYMASSWSLAASVLVAMTLRDWLAGTRPALWRAALVLAPMAVLGLIWTAPVIALVPWPIAAWGIAAPITAAALAAWILSRPPTPARQRALAGIVTAHATLLFMLPLFAGTHDRKIDAPSIQFLQTHLGLGRFVSFGPIVPNYGTFFGIAEVDDNYLPTPTVWVDAVRDRFDARTDGVNFYPVVLPKPDALARLLPAYAAVGVRYAVTWPWDAMPAMREAPALVFAGAQMKIWELRGAAPYSEAAGCTITGDRDRMAAACERPASLVRRELAWPGWRAWVNGVEAAIGSDGLFQQVALPAGRSEIVFAYAPPGVGIAFAACLAGIAVLVAGAAAGRPSRKQEGWGGRAVPPNLPSKLLHRHTGRDIAQLRHKRQPGRDLG
jgi:peptidoglycan/LPS O-acetylase OafA/YrhL